MSSFYAFYTKYLLAVGFWHRRCFPFHWQRHLWSTKLAGRSERLWMQQFFVCLGSIALTGCNVHPIVDDVSPIPNENIIASARCELRLGLVSAVKNWFIDDKITDFNPDFLGDQIEALKRRYGGDPTWVDRLKGYESYLAIALAYNWNFEITEVNSEDAKVGFQIPYLSPSTFGITAGKTITKTRVAKRAFSTGETFSALLTRDYYDFCRGAPSAVASGSVPVGPIPRQPNILYPITGSIGLDKAVNTFLAVASQGGGGDTGFVDTLTFTTVVTGNIHPSITLNPVPASFRLVSAETTLTATRTDLHMVTISLAFPKVATAAALADAAAASAPERVAVAGNKKAAPTKPEQKSPATEAVEAPAATAEGSKPVQVLISLLQSRDGPGAKAMQEVHRLTPLWQARYNLCVQDGRTREDQLNVLRFTAPEVYCIEYTDAFVPRAGSSGRSPSSYSIRARG